MLVRVTDHEPAGGPGPLLPIGAFARLARLSVKQLRHYADLGLLPPARIDPATGYRYYRPDQARDAMAIGLLRSLDVPLAAIAKVIAGPEGLGALAEVRDRLDEELARRRRALATLERILADGLPRAEVTVGREEPQRVVVVRDVADGPDDIGRVTSGCVARLLSALLPRLRPGEPPRLTGLFPVDLDDHVPVTVAGAVPAATATAAAAAGETAAGETAAGETAAGDGPWQAPAGADPVGGATADVLPGGTFARATHVGPYDEIPLTAHALLSWCASHGHAPAGPLREVYVSDPATTPPDQLVTHLHLPLETP